MKRRLLQLALAGLTGATLLIPAAAHAATPSSVLYDSTPVKGTVSAPSVGAEAYSFSQVGNEVILRNHTAAVRHVFVTMVSWACQHGNWNAGCTTTPGTTFTAPITLNLYRHSRTDQTTGAVVPGRRILSITRNFRIHYRPSSLPADGGEYDGTTYKGRDGQPHHGLAQTIAFPMNVKLPSDVVWTVSYNTSHHGPKPLGDAAPGTVHQTDNLNVGLTPKARVGLDRLPHSIFWDTTYAPFTCGGGFQTTGLLNRDGACTMGAWDGMVPAAQFSTK